MSVRPTNRHRSSVLCVRLLAALSLIHLFSGAGVAHALGPPAPAEQERLSGDAWPHYERAIKAMEQIDEEWRESEPSRLSASLLVEELSDGNWDDPRLSGPKEALAALAPLLPLANRAAVFIDCTIPDDAEASGPPDFRADDQRLSTVMDVLRLGRVCRSALRAALETGEWEQAVRLLRTQLRMARHVANQPLPTAWILGMSIHNQALAEARLAAMEGALPIAAVHELADTIKQAPFPAELGELALDEWSRTHRELWRWLVTTDDEAKRDEVIGWMTAFPLGIAAAVVDQDVDQAAVDRGQRAYKGLIELGPDRALRIHSQLTSALRTWWRSPPWRRGELDVSIAPKETGPVAHAFAGGFVRAVQAEALLQSRRAGTLVLLRLAAYKDRHGEWPERLTDAMTEDQAIDPMSGEMFDYQVTPEGESPIRLAIPEAASDIITPPGRDKQFDNVRVLTGPRKEIYEPEDDADGVKEE